MRFIIVNVWVMGKISGTDIDGEQISRRRRIDLKKIHIEESSNANDTIIYDEFNEYLFTVNLPFDKMNEHMDNYHATKQMSLNLLWLN